MSHQNQARGRFGGRSRDERERGRGGQRDGGLWFEILGCADQSRVCQASRRRREFYVRHLSEQVRNCQVCQCPM